MTRPSAAQRLGNGCLSTKQPRTGLFYSIEQHRDMAFRLVIGGFAHSRPKRATHDRKRFMRQLAARQPVCSSRQRVSVVALPRNREAVLGVHAITNAQQCCVVGFQLLFARLAIDKLETSPERPHAVAMPL